MIKGVNEVIANLKKVRNALNLQIDNLFMKKSLEWIRDRAIEILKTRLSYEENYFLTNVTNISSWKIIENKNYFRLENTFDNSASIEFGIGVIGEEYPHILSQSIGYEYNIPTESKSIDGSFSFEDEKTGIVFYRFRGYEGKSFLYNAFMEYKQNNIWVKKYQEAFDEIMTEVLK